MKIRVLFQLFGSFALLCSSCAPDEEVEEIRGSDSMEITKSDIDLQIREGASQEQAEQLLKERFGKVQAALDAGIMNDPVARSEIARILIKRHRETELQPKIRSAIASVTEERIRELYEKNIARFQKPERRQVAILWLNPGADPQRKSAYLAKLQKARKWFLENPELTKNPDGGFLTLSIDHSEHSGSRFKGGVIGWVERDVSDSWLGAVSKIAFETTELSEVVEHEEGLFLVRVMDKEAARTQLFETVQETLRKQEVARLRKEIEMEFEGVIASASNAVN